VHLTAPAHREAAGFVYRFLGLRTGVPIHADGTIRLLHVWYPAWYLGVTSAQSGVQLDPVRQTAVGMHGRLSFRWPLSSMLVPGADDVQLKMQRYAVDLLCSFYSNSLQRQAFNTEVIEYRLASTL
jgi:hypothetical protein